MHVRCLLACPKPSHHKAPHTAAILTRICAVVSKEQLQCKHLVAVSVAEMTATVIQREVSDTDFADLLC